MNLKDKLINISNFPKEGVEFKDITSLLKDKEAFKECIIQMANYCKGKNVDMIVGAEARGFLMGAPLAYEIGAGFIPVRKTGKLPRETISHEYALEYGTDKLEIHKDDISKGDKVLIVDDLLATGGTALASIKMVEELGGEVVGVIFLIELTELKGIEKLKGYDVKSIVKF